MRIGDRKIIGGDNPPPHFEKIERARRDDELIRENSTQIKERLLQGKINIENRQDIIELADQLSGNKELACAISRRTIGFAKFNTLMKR